MLWMEKMQTRMLPSSVRLLVAACCLPCWQLAGLVLCRHEAIEDGGLGCMLLDVYPAALRERYVWH